MTDHRKNVSAALLAGGRSRRMGRDKAMLEIGERRLIQRVADAVAAVAEDRFLVGCNPDAYPFLGWRAIPDDVPDRGPMGGLLTALRAAENEICLVVACDMPFLTSSLLQKLITALGNAPAVAVESAGRLEPLCAVYTQPCLAIVEETLAEGRLGMQRLLSRLQAKQMPLSAEELICATNVNDAQSYRAAREMAANNETGRPG